MQWHLSGSDLFRTGLTKFAVPQITGSVEVTNCFAVTHSDKQDEVFLDKKFQKTMSDLHLRGETPELSLRPVLPPSPGPDILPFHPSQ